MVSVIVTLTGRRHCDLAVPVAWLQGRRDSANGSAVGRAEASKLLALAEARLAEDPTEALLLAGISLEQADTREARAFLMKALREAPLAFESVVGDQAGRMPAFSPDGKWLAAGGQSSVARVWSEDGHDPIALPGLETSPRATIIPAWASNYILVTGFREGTSGDRSPGLPARRIHVWSGTNGRTPPDD